MVAAFGRGLLLWCRRSICVFHHNGHSSRWPWSLSDWAQSSNISFELEAQPLQLGRVQLIRLLPVGVGQSAQQFQESGCVRQFQGGNGGKKILLSVTATRAYLNDYWPPGNGEISVQFRGAGQQRADLLARETFFHPSIIMLWQAGNRSVVPFPKVVRAMAYGMWVVRKLLGLGCSHNSGISGTVSCHKKITETYVWVWIFAIRNVVQEFGLPNIPVWFLCPEQVGEED
jgi:hypothetical protein